jgi:hypothetical protein
VTVRCLLAAVALVVAGCGGPSTDNAALVLQRTAANLGEISSGTLAMRFEMSVKDRDPGGFELEGPFSFASKGHLPVLELEHTRFDGDEEAASGTFVSTGDVAWVVREGKPRRVPDGVLRSSGLTDLVRPAEAASAAPGAESGDASSGLAELNIDDWIEGEPEVSGGGRVGGVDTDKVAADLDAGAVMDGLIKLSRALGGGVAAQLQPLDETQRAKVRRAATDTTLETWSGKDDHLLRKLVLDVTFGTRNETLAEAVPQLAEARIKLEATVTDLNEPVEVDAPAGD